MRAIAPIAISFAAAAEGATAGAVAGVGVFTVEMAHTPEPNVAETTATDAANSTQPASEISGSSASGEVPTPRGRSGSIDELTPEQAGNYKRYVKKLPSKSEPVRSRSWRTAEHV